VTAATQRISASQTSSAHGYRCRAPPSPPAAAVSLRRLLRHHLSATRCCPAPCSPQRGDKHCQRGKNMLSYDARGKHAAAWRTAARTRYTCSRRRDISSCMRLAHGEGEGLLAERRDYLIALRGLPLSAQAQGCVALLLLTTRSFTFFMRHAGVSFRALSSAGDCCMLLYLAGLHSARRTARIQLLRVGVIALPLSCTEQRRAAASALLLPPLAQHGARA